MLAVGAGLLVAVLAVLLQLFPGVEMRAFEQHASNNSTGGSGATLVGQSFTSPRDNLSRVDLLFDPNASHLGAIPASGKVRLLARDGPGGAVIYEVALNTLDATSGYALSFTFPPISGSAGVTYTVALESPDSALSRSIVLGYNSFDALSAGSMYLGDRSQAGDLAITAYYRYDLSTLAGDVATALTRDYWLLASWLLVLLLPGMSLLVWLPNRLSIGQRLLAVPCVSVLALPVFYLLMRSLGMRVGDVLLWVLLALCASGLVGRWWIKRSSVTQQSSPTPNQPNPKSKIQNPKSADLAFWGLFGVVLFVTLASRLLSLRDAYAGAGIDAYHHTLISELFVQSGGIPSDYMPYAPLASFTYHFGFHSLVATVGWVAGLTSAGDMLTLMPLAGQIADTLPVLALTLFGWKALGNRWAGLAAGTLAGVVSVFPGFYVNWSRYTQGLGLALLPVAWVFFLEVINRPSPPTGVTRPTGRVTWHGARHESGPYILAVITAVGLALTHYRIIIIYGLFAAMYLSWRLFASLRARRSPAEALTPIWRGVVVGVLTLLALLPWLVNLRQNFTTNFVNRDPETRRAYYDLNVTIGAELLNHWGLLLMGLLALGGIGWAFKRRDPLPLLPLATWFVLLLWSSPYAFSDLLNSYPYWIADVASRTRLALFDGRTLVSMLVLAIGGVAGAFKWRDPLPLLPLVAWLGLLLWSAPYAFPDVLKSYLLWIVWVALLLGWVAVVLRMLGYKMQPLLLPIFVLLFLPPWPGLFQVNVRLPYAGYLDATTLVQGLWLPLSLPAGYTLAELGRWMLGLGDAYKGRAKIAWRYYTAGAVALVALAGGLAAGFALGARLDINPYIAEADVAAFNWMEGHLRRDAYVLANPFAFSWDPEGVHGSDAGLWVPLMVRGVRSSVPPLPAYNERPSYPDYMRNLRDIVAFEPFNGQRPDWQALKRAGITHIYVGSRGGALYVPDLMKSKAAVAEVFHKDRVWVFELK
jgi:hypothetical protein